MRWPLAVAATFLLAGCGATAPGGGSAPIVPGAPPITAAAEAPPEDIARFLRQDFAPTLPPTDPSASSSVRVVELCAVADAGTAPPASSSCPPPSPEQEARFRTQVRVQIR